jgi:hypothetical protein
MFGQVYAAERLRAIDAEHRQRRPDITPSQSTPAGRGQPGTRLLGTLLRRVGGRLDAWGTALLEHGHGIDGRAPAQSARRRLDALREPQERRAPRRSTPRSSVMWRSSPPESRGWMKNSGPDSVSRSLNRRRPAVE